MFDFNFLKEHIGELDLKLGNLNFLSKLRSVMNPRLVVNQDQHLTSMWTPRARAGIKRLPDFSMSPNFLW